jgi:hypothetical protein
VSNNHDFSVHGHLTVLLDALGPSLPADVKRMLFDIGRSRKQTVPLSFDGDTQFSITGLFEMLSEAAKKPKSARRGPPDETLPATETVQVTGSGETLPINITFPYSRHSSLEELRNFVGKFRPRDVCQCVIDEANWSEDRDSARSLYGDLCVGHDFAQDAEMKLVHEARILMEREWEEMEHESLRKNLLYTQLDGDGETQLLERMEAVVAAERMADRSYDSSPKQNIFQESFFTPLPASEKLNENNPQIDARSSTASDGSPQNSITPIKSESKKWSAISMDIADLPFTASFQEPDSLPLKCRRLSPQTKAGSSVQKKSPEKSSGTSKTLQVVLAPQSSFETSKIPNLPCAYQSASGLAAEYCRDHPAENTDRRVLETAVSAAMEAYGLSWWDIELESVTPKDVSYQSEIEL